MSVFLCVCIYTKRSEWKIKAKKTQKNYDNVINVTRKESGIKSSLNTGGRRTKHHSCSSYL